MHTCNIHGVAAQKGRRGSTDGTPRKKGKKWRRRGHFREVPTVEKVSSGEFTKSSQCRVALPLPLLMVAPFAYNTGREPHPAWGAERVIPLSKEEIEDIFLDLQQKFGFQRDSMRNMVRFVYCVPRHLALIVHDHPSSTSRCICLTAVRHACPPTRHSLRFMRTTSGANTQITASSTLLPSLISTMLLVILKTQVFSASAPSVGVAATIPRSP